MKNNYKASLFGLCQNPAFTEASAEELRVLLTLVSLDGAPTEESDITRLAGVSAARCRAAIAFWEGAGILSVNKTTGIVEEFEERLSAGEIDEEPTLKVAETIRDENLAMMIEECQALMGVPCLSNQEVANLTNLHKQYQLSAEHIVVLAAFLQSKGEFTIRKLCNKAISLEKKGISTADDLEKYIVSLDSSDEWEFRRIIGIYGRNLSQGERDLFKKWAEEYGYTSAIVSEAYDIAVMNTFELREDIDISKKTLISSMEQKIVNEKRIVQGVSDLLKANIRSKINEAKNTVDKCVIMLRENDPRNILSKGYAAVTESGGAVITSVKSIKIGEEYTIQLTDGSFVARAIEKKDK
jgi:hypothetical protein